MMYTAWGKDGTDYTFVEGDQPAAWLIEGEELLKVFEAESWEDAMRQYHEWQGWEPYKPMADG